MHTREKRDVGERREKGLGEQLGLIENTNVEISVSDDLEKKLENAKDEKAVSEAIAKGVTVSGNKAQQLTASSDILQSPEIQQRIVTAQKPEIATNASASTLAQQAENQFSGSSKAFTGAMQASPINVQNKTQVDVKVIPSNVALSLDGEKIGETAMQYVTQQNIRSGDSEIE